MTEVTLTDPITNGLAEGRPPVQWRFTCHRQIPGWPFPPIIADHFQRSRYHMQRGMAQWKVDAAIDTIREWLEKAPLNSEAHRTAQQWILANPCYQRLFEIVASEFAQYPPEVVEKALLEFKES